MLVDTLVALHRIEPAAVGLEAFGRPDGFLQRQVSRWHRQFQASVLDGSAVAAGGLEGSVVQALTEQLPESARAGIVHGDYRLTNVLFGPDLGGGRAGSRRWWTGRWRPWAIR